MKKNIILSVIIILTLSACTTLTIKNASFGWPIESVLKSDITGKVSEPRYAINFNIKQIVKAETGSYTDFKNREIRLIRNIKGFYFVTAKSFKHVYVFNVNNGEFVLENKIKVSEKGLVKPVFNQREPEIELIDGNYKALLTHKEAVRK